MNKKQLYESIMRNVSHEVKKALNEQEIKYDFYTVNKAIEVKSDYMKCEFIPKHFYKTYEHAVIDAKTMLMDNTAPVLNCKGYIDVIENARYDYDKKTHSFEKVGPAFNVCNSDEQLLFIDYLIVCGEYFADRRGTGIRWK